MHIQNIFSICVQPSRNGLVLPPLRILQHVCSSLFWFYLTLPLLILLFLSNEWWCFNRNPWSQIYEVQQKETKNEEKGKGSPICFLKRKSVDILKMCAKKMQQVCWRGLQVWFSFSVDSSLSWAFAVIAPISSARWSFLRYHLSPACTLPLWRNRRERPAQVYTLFWKIDGFLFLHEIDFIHYKKTIRKRK